MDAHNVMLTLCEFSYVALPFGIATAATIRVGNMLGAGNHASARRSGVFLLLYILILLLLLLLLLYIINPEFPVLMVYVLPSCIFTAIPPILRYPPFPPFLPACKRQTIFFPAVVALDRCTCNTAPDVALHNRVILGNRKEASLQPVGLMYSVGVH